MRTRSSRLCPVLVALAVGACAQVPTAPGAGSPRTGAPASATTQGAPAQAQAQAQAQPGSAAATPAPMVVPPPVATAPSALPPVVVPPPAASLPVPMPAVPSTAATPPAAAAAGFALEPGLYRCELNRQVMVRRVAPDGQSVEIQWLKRDYTLTAVMSRAGALRYDDIVSGLAWITIPGKSMLLDTKKGSQLAQDCKL